MEKVFSFRVKQFVLLCGDLVIIILATHLAYFIRLGHFFGILRIHTGASTISLGLYIIFLYIFDLYNPYPDKLPGEVGLRSFLAVTLACSPIAICFYYLPQWKYGRGIWLLQMILVWLLTLLWRRIYVYIFKPLEERKQNVLIIGAGRTGHFFYEWINTGNTPFRVAGFLDDDPGKLGMSMSEAKVLGRTDQILKIGQKNRIHTALLAITHNRRPNLIKKVLEAKLKGWDIHDIVWDYERLTGRVPVQHINDEWLLFYDGFYILRTSIMQKTKRLIDLIWAILFLILFSPIILITALAIRLDSKGPIIFRQSRVGKDGKQFNLLKFRSMKYNAEENGAVWAQKKDPRITHVGRLIRFLRIDEIPQMINVIRGEMSLIGPRPERPEFIVELEKQIPYYFIRHTVKPGITGWAQIRYPYGSSVEDSLNKMEYDLYYIKNMSLLLDIQIFFKTIGVILFGQGAR